MRLFVVIVIAGVSTLIYFYISRIEFRKWVDINVLRKDISTDDVPTIDLHAEKNNQIFCYSNYISILKDKNLSLYNSNGMKETEISIDINTAIFVSNDKYLLVAEKNGQNFCIILDKTFLWKEKIDGEISKAYINKNGYVGIVTTDTTYKSIITLYSPEGKQILRYLSSTRAIDIAISNDNNYIAFAELDTSGTLINSSVKVISVEKAKINSEEAIVYTYNSDTSKMITKIKYQEKNGLICMFDKSVDIIRDENVSSLIDINNNITFTSGNLNNHIAYIKEETSGLFNYNSNLIIKNTTNNHETIYHFDEIAKEMYTYGNIIGINVGTEIYFINTNGMLLKKYNSNQEITNVILSNNVAIVVYKDRVEVINL